MPTRNRRRFVPRAIDYFLRQEEAASELLIVDDGEDRVRDVVPEHPRVRYLALPQRVTLGAKRNVACEQASGDVIVHWDDDDWHAPHRIRYQVDALLSHDADACGIDQVLFYDCRHRTAWMYCYPGGERPWLYGSSLCYRRSFWERHRFPDVNVGEDTQFIWQARHARLQRLADSTFHVSIVHGGNTSGASPSGALCRPASRDAVRKLLGVDLDFYDGITGGGIPR